MRWALIAVAVPILVLVPGGPVGAGLYDPTQAPLHPVSDPQQFLIRQLAELRAYGPPDALLGGQASSVRDQALVLVRGLRDRGERLTAAEVASLGYLLLRLRRTQPTAQDFDEALQVLETGRRAHPRDFYVLTNLATAYQLTGRLDAAISVLQDALDYAPAELRPLERYHLQLLRERSREQVSPGLAPLDRLFIGPDRNPVRYVGPSGAWEVGKLADAERARLPNASVEEAMRVVQHLLLWFPDDARLMWQYGELANAAGDLKTAALALGQAVYNFRLSTPQLKERRFLLQEAVAWREVLARAGEEDRQLTWLIQIVAGAVPAGPQPDVSGTLIAQGVPLPRPKDLFSGGLLLGGGPSAGDPVQEPPVNWFATITWQGWTAIGIGVAVMLGLFLLQMREWLRKRSAAPRVAAVSAASPRQAPPRP